MGEIAINPQHNVFKQYRKVNYINPYVFTPVATYNTYIGGVSGTIFTASLLATKLGISVGAISNFEVVGSDIKCLISGSYGSSVNFGGVSSLSYFNDVDGLVISLPASAFEGTKTGADYFYFPNCTNIGNNCFYNDDKNNLIGYIYIPRCTSIGTTVNNASDVVFGLNQRVKKIYVDSSMATINSGSIEADLAYTSSFGFTTISYVTNFTAPNPVTTLAAGTIYNTAIQLNFTAPSSTNAIDYYECYANGVLKNRISASGGYITGLTASTSYNITLIAVDIFYNKSVVSNSISVTTDNKTWDISTGLISYYKLDETSGSVANDYFGGKNLTNTSITVNQSGKIGTSYLSTANTQKLETLTATPITGNFTINLWVYRTAAPSSVLGGIIQQGDYSTNNGFGLWLWTDSALSWRINQTFRNVAGTLIIPLNTWTMISYTYDGTNVKIYLNGVLQITTAHTSNPTTTTKRTLFYNQNNNASYIGRIDETAIYNTALTQTEIDLLYNSGSGITL